jgi:ABC-type sugar transport system ATPase subunit
MPTNQTQRRTVDFTIAPGERIGVYGLEGRGSRSVRNVSVITAATRISAIR